MYLYNKKLEQKWTIKEKLIHLKMYMKLKCLKIVDIKKFYNNTNKKKTNILI